MIQGLGQGLAVSFTTGVVQGANFAEMRDLTVTCVPTAKRAWCLTVANHQASPSYFQVDVTTIQDAGDGPRWGFRNTEASPKFDQVRISVAHGTSNYGIVNALGSAPTIRRSFIKVVHGAADNNGILDVNDGSASLVADTTIQVRDASTVYGIRNFGEDTPAYPLVLRRVEILADNATSGSFGVYRGLQNLVVEHSTLDVRGPNGQCIDRIGYTVTVTNSELVGAQALVVADTVNIGSSWLRGGGYISAGLERCAGVYTNNFTFYPNTCP